MSMFEGVRWKFLIIRLLLSALFSFFLLIFFMPRAGLWGWIVMTGLLLFFAYVFEAAHQKKETSQKGKRG
ncbi:hypothetical protein [Thermodesulforhabdus norvegica]|uniref:Uncharacterized protein n=1 Tax=Thermodesulforhabdus norvegica TaxID=39841 RepID=A0A1I4SEK1_9BACT|nr:hypothetical protein [Thermodesulforhabdus norvegica]SFM62713.1 hypothetical protein SAMN05660836_00913 [Thermodesulforhabdus norvegica]